MNLLIQLPKIPSAPGMYTLFARKEDSRIPIYVGESANVRRRMGEYIVATFSATTDFIVGEAVRHLQDKGVEIEVEIALFDGDDIERRSIEKETIRNFKTSGLALLNRNAENPGYNYKTADEVTERKRVRAFVDEHILPRLSK